MNKTKNSFNRSTLSDRIYEEIKRAILFHEIPLGNKLGEIELSERYQVSATPVREALKRLTSDGFLEYKPYAGHILKEPSIKEISDLYDVRCSLETLALKQSFDFLTNHDLVTLEKIIKNQIDKFKEQDSQNLKSQHEWNEEFHNFFIYKSSNKWLAKNMEMINDHLFWVRVPLTKVKKPDQSLEEHMSILNAIKNEDINSAIESLKEHIERVKNDVIRFSKNK